MCFFQLGGQVMSKISVIVPVFKVEAYLPRCIDSILKQTFSDFRLILVDDGSPDKCPEICDKYAELDNRVVVIHKKNEGLSAARNSGIDFVFEKNCSDWISFIDSDDWIHEKFLETLFNAVSENNVPIASCCWQRIDEEKDAIQPEDFSSTLISPSEDYKSRRNNYDVDTYAWRFLYHKDLFKNIRYPVGKHWEDLSTTYKLLFQADKVAHTSAVLYYYFARNDSIARADWNPRRLDMLDALEENIQFFKENPQYNLYDRLVICSEKSSEAQLAKLYTSPLSATDKERYGKIINVYLNKFKYLRIHKQTI